MRKGAEHRATPPASSVQRVCAILEPHHAVIVYNDRTAPRVVLTTTHDY